MLFLNFIILIVYLESSTLIMLIIILLFPESISSHYYPYINFLRFLFVLNEETFGFMIFDVKYEIFGYVYEL